MNTRKNHSIIPVLMILSQLLLTVFVIQWLGSQYREERKILLGNLKSYYIDSQNALLDSMLLKTYVDPVLSDTTIFIMKSSGKVNDTLVKKAVFTSGNGLIKDIRRGDSAFITVSLKSYEDSSVNIISQPHIQNSPDELLLKSVKLIVAHMHDTAISGNRVVRRFSFNLDTSEFKSTYAGKLKGSGMAFAIAWDCTADSSSNARSLKGLMVNPSSGTAMPAAFISGYSGYLFARIMPQILFGFILVVITALAFFASYRSIKYQSAVNELRDEFIGNITHELKTPVSTLRLALESLRNINMKADPGMLEEYLGLATSETIRLEELINRVLDHSQLEEHENSLDLKELEIDSLINEVVDLMSHRPGMAGRIEFRVTGDKKRVMGDRLYLHSVLVNLIDNSIKYCDKEPLIKIELRSEGRHNVIEVSDNGPGIPRDYLGKIFDKFFRVPADNIHNVKGYGLGLSFVSLVITLHKGRVEVRNLNPGCSFIISLPSV